MYGNIRRQLKEICKITAPNWDESKPIKEFISKETMLNIKNTMINYIMDNNISIIGHSNLEDLGTEVSSLITRSFMLFPEFNGGTVIGDKPFSYYKERDNFVKSDDIYKKLNRILASVKSTDDVYEETYYAILNRASNLRDEFDKRRS
jgi:hypothetical protein